MTFQLQSSVLGGLHRPPIVVPTAFSCGAL
jgi:hypothetical protein